MEWQVWREVVASRVKKQSSTVPPHTAILLHLAIDRYANKPPGCLVQKLDDLTSFPGELPPAAGLFWILLDRVVFATIHVEGDPAKALSAGAAYGNGLVPDLYLCSGHHLLRD